MRATQDPTATYDCRVLAFVLLRLGSRSAKRHREAGRFNAVRVSFDTIAWPNGADLCPEVLYEESVPVQESLPARVP
ncbi:MAG: DUF2442 domain-containing protein [Planctomycetes bacterium]|nr:DUF2442 domain-containing protein [Planctomycetota bacterium]